MTIAEAWKKAAGLYDSGLPCYGLCFAMRFYSSGDWPKAMQHVVKIQKARHVDYIWPLTKEGARCRASFARAMAARFS